MLKVPHCRPATDPRFSKVTLEYSLGLNLVYTNFGVLILVMRDSEIVAVQFRDQNARLCAEASWNLRQQSVMVGILLFENIRGPDFSSTIASTWLVSILTSRNFLGLSVSITLINEYGVCASRPPLTT